MAIHFSDQSDELPVNHEINVTPFIDVMLVLLIIFMVAAPLATVDVKVDLPVSNAAPAPRPDKPVYLSIDADNHMRVGNRAVSEAELGTGFAAAPAGDPEARVFVRADKSVTYETIMRGMNALRSAGYIHVALVAADGSAQ